MSGTKPKRRRRRWPLVVLGLLIGVGAAGYWIWNRANAAPEWYGPPDANDEEVAALAERVEYGLVETFHKIREPEETWTLRVTEAQLNAWLAARLPDWMRYEGDVAWPDALGAPQLNITPDGIEIGLAVSSGGAASRVVVTRLAPRVENGAVTFDLDRVGVGRLRVPGSTGALADVVESLASAGMVDAAFQDELNRLLVDALNGPTFELADGRTVEILDVTLEEGTMDLTSRTKPREQ